MGFTYKNKSDQELVIPQVGAVKPGATIASENKLENENLEEVSGQQTQTPIQQPSSPSQPQQPIQNSEQNENQAKEEAK